MIFVGTMNIRPSGINDQSAVHQNVGFAIGVVGADELITQADFAAKVARPGLFREKRIGTGFDQAAVHAFGDQHSAETRTGFEHTRIRATAPARRCFSSVNAAESPEIPPPMMAMRFMFRCDRRVRHQP